MLARLARWLRVLGFDTAFDPSVQDHDLVAIAAAQDRVLLTRDRHLVLHLRPRRVHLVTCDAPLAQLREVATACGLSLRRELFTRCLVCNARLENATLAEVTLQVPERARSPDARISRCPDCGRVYWAGSHVERMRAALARAFPEAF